MNNLTKDDLRELLIALIPKENQTIANKLLNILLEKELEHLEEKEEELCEPEFVTDECKAKIITDQVQEFINTNLEKTNNEEDIVGKCQLFDLFKSQYSSNVLIPSEFMEEIKKRGIKYDKSKQINKIKGVYRFVKLIKPNENNANNAYEELIKKHNELLADNENLLNENEILRKEIIELNCKLAIPKKKIIRKTIIQPVIEPIVEAIVEPIVEPVQIVENKEEYYDDFLNIINKVNE